MLANHSDIVYVTGARGFLGRYVARRLSADGRRVIGLGHGSWPDREFASWGVTDWLNGDVSPANLDILSARHGHPSIVFHLAGGSSVGASLTAPAEDFQRTVSSTVAVAEWIRSRTPATVGVLASSAAVYGVGHDKPIPERAICRPTSPYGFHKRIAEQVFESYATTYNLSLPVVRIFSAYGVDLKKQLLWDLCVRLASEPKRIELGGSGMETRDFVHVTDIADLFAIIAAGQTPPKGVLNCGSGTPRTVRDVAESVVDAWGRSCEIQFSNQCRVGDPTYLVAAHDAAQRFGFEAKMTWEKGVAEYVRWFKASAIALTQ